MDIHNTLSKLDQLGCAYAFYYHPTGREAVFEANCERFSSASIIKIPILLSWIHLERQGLVDRAELCDLDSEPQVQGAGFSWLLRGRKLPYQDVLMLMIALSDNLCTNLIIERIGLARLQQTMRETLGLTGTQIQRKLMDFAARERGLDNWVAASEAIRFYALMSALTPTERDWAEAMLLVNQDDALLKRNLTRDTVDFYHKTGSVAGVLHDWGYTRSTEMFLFTQKVPQEQPVFEVFGELGELLAG
ncbi:MAG TPA: class A beta-lactamase-related serine hydrolase [Anaerolineaceae bacterium]|nr:class A beta-lactamase-related serine hydrolase [Anaerolineaceae bacterium]HNS36987.1 class A beta-lactamase-related serine hydrolase [Anaerolineaceae bacterium]HNZ12739.1 class A beta-lactamase-related serine hydrolase [Anaerolineaceae bacterium]HOD03885.1 class A beta-lactamase-related serine hydrolase [Anaerolineaceae bacterium]HOG79932.1 class A beta-lactamase-related serine hydrolase [Anaerolineaceae bacterium]